MGNEQIKNNESSVSEKYMMIAADRILEAGKLNVEASKENLKAQKIADERFRRIANLVYFTLFTFVSTVVYLTVYFWYYTEEEVAVEEETHYIIEQETDNGDGINNMNNITFGEKEDG